MSQKESASEPDMKVAALDYAARGLPVFPCNPSNKRPYTEHGFKDATTDAGRIKSWWRRWPRAMIGIPTGPASGFDVLDLDVKNGKDGFLFVPDWNTRSSVISRTASGGAHLYFRSDDTIRCTSDVIARGVDTRGTGGYVIVPPSTGYAWINDSDLSALPSWPEDLRPPTREKPRASHENEERPPEDVDPERIAAALDVIPSDDYQVWLEVGAALRRALGESGFPIFEAWSAKSQKFDPDECRSKWFEFERITGFGIGTIFHYATQADPNWWKQEDAPRDDQPSGSTGDHKKQKERSSGLVIRSLTSYEMEPVNWLWPNRIPLGKLSIIIGDPQEGKSQIAANIEARVSRGNAWPNGEGFAPQGSILIFAAEDGVADTIRPRFEAAGGDPNKVHIIEAVHLAQGIRAFDLSTDLERLEAEVRRIGDVRLIRFDPITAYMGKPGKLDSHSNTDVRAVLTAVSALADRCRVTILGISHLAKNSTAKAAVSAIGSVAFSAAARTVHLVTPDTEQPGRRLFLRAKNNLAPANVPGLAYRFEVRQVAEGITAPVIVWDRERITVTADEALAAAKGGRSNNQARAVVWLRTVLSNGPRAAEAVGREGEAAGFTEKMLRVAREKLGVIVSKGKGRGAPWTWALPDVREQQGQEQMEF